MTAPKAALPIVNFSDGVTFYLNRETIKVLHAPNAHTNGDSIVHFVEADVIHMGDTFSTGSILYRFPTWGAIEGMVKVADRVIAMATSGTKIIPGHGPLSNKVELKVYRDMLEGGR